MLDLDQAIAVCGVRLARQKAVLYRSGTNDTRVDEADSAQTIAEIYGHHPALVAAEICGYVDDCWEAIAINLK